MKKITKMIFALGILAMIASSCSKTYTADTKNTTPSPKHFESVSAEVPEKAINERAFAGSNDIVAAPTMVEVEKLAAKIEENTAKTDAATAGSNKMTEAEKQTLEEAKARAKNMSKAEKKELRKDVKDMLKDFKAKKKEGSTDASTNTLLLVIIAILLPWAAVWLYEGALTSRVLIAFLLWLLFYLPGLIYALIVILG